jgi:hypothetical protein
MTEPTEPVKQVEGAPLTYMTLHPLVPEQEAVRLATVHIGAWGAHVRNTGEPPRSFVTTVWGATFECSETVAELDAIMGYVAPVTLITP